MELTRKQLADALGISAQSISAWLRDGLPSELRATHGKRKSAFFDVGETLEWLVLKNKTKHIRALDAMLPHDTELVDYTDAEDGDPDTSLNPMQMADQMIADAWIRYKTAGDNVKHVMQEQWEHALDARRKLRNDHAKAERSLGEMMPTSEHERIMYEDYAIVRNALLNLPKQMAGAVAKRTARECLAILTAACRDCCRSLAAKEGDV